MRAALPTPFAPDDGPEDAPSGEAGRAARRLALLAELAETGMDLARAVHRQATGEAQDGSPPADPALAFSRISRAVRLTLALEARIEADRAAATAARPPRPPDGERAVDKLMRRLLGPRPWPQDDLDGEDAEASDPCENDGGGEACERPDAETEADPDAFGRPAGEVIGAIRKDLGGGACGQAAPTAPGPTAPAAIRPEAPARAPPIPGLAPWRGRGGGPAGGAEEPVPP